MAIFNLIYMLEKTFKGTALQDISPQFILASINFVIGGTNKVP